MGSWPEGRNRRREASGRRADTRLWGLCCGRWTPHLPQRAAQLGHFLRGCGAPLSRVRFVPLVPTASHLRRIGRASWLHV